MKFLFGKNNLTFISSPNKSMDSDKLKMLKVNNLVITIPANWKLSLDKVQIYFKLKVSSKCLKVGTFYFKVVKK